LKSFDFDILDSKGLHSEDGDGEDK
jgi:hypothetical protein